jgi:NAD(P)-dependent dehydrogenase (short-subunit alcohol dehydrogenase family)
MNKSSRSNLPLFAGLAVTGAAIAGAALTGAAVAGVATTAAFVLRNRLNRDTRVSGKVVVITGASRGLGLALAERFARVGSRLVLASRSLDELTHARDLLHQRGALKSPDEALLVPTDVSEPDQATQLVERAIAHFGRIDVLINNAGIIEVGAVEDQPLEAYRRAMETNFFGALHTIRAALPQMLRQAVAPYGPRPAIVNIASIGGKVAVPHLLPYVASKFALVGFSEGLHAELRQKGVRVTTVCPGLMRTGGDEHAHFLGQAEKEARWFQWSAKTPGLSASVGYAANRIYGAVLAGRAEITITPQAWLAARFHGLCPETAQLVASLANEYILPAPATPAPRPSAYVPPPAAAAPAPAPTDWEASSPSSEPTRIWLL